MKFLKKGPLNPNKPHAPANPQEQNPIHIPKKALATSKSRRWLSRTLTTLLVLMIFSGLYILSLVYAPKLAPILNKGDVEKVIANTQAQTNQDRLYIPKLGLNMPISPGEDEEIMQENIWHRFPERGDPKAGGNFILSAHRWKSGRTPAESIKLSTLYNIDKLKTNDTMTVDFAGQRYIYRIYEIKQIERSDTYIEDTLLEGQPAHLTLYTCTLKGWEGPRIVVFAKPI